MKILVVDVGTCWDCPCCYQEFGMLGDIVRAKCQVTGKKNLVYMDAVSGVPNWCPLRPIPQKRDYSNELADTKGNDMYMEGWNDCLEELEK